MDESRLEMFQRRVETLERRGRIAFVGLLLVATTLMTGALASSVSHDSHNLTVVGDRSG